MIEFDVTLLSSGELILMHDDTLDRTTSGSGFVAHHPYSAIRELTLHEGQSVLTLEEALDFIDKWVAVNIELKNRGSGTVVATVLADYIGHRGWSAEMFMVSSADHIEIKNFKKLMPHVETGAIISAIPVDYAAFAERADADVAVMDDELLTKEYVDDAHARGIQVYVYSFYKDDINRIEKIKLLGADGMYVNYPDKARLILRTIKEPA